MNTIRAYIYTLIEDIKDAFTKDAAGLIASIKKIEAGIERTIDKESRRLEGLRTAADQLNAAIKSANTEVDTAYKLLHKVSELVK